MFERLPRALRLALDWQRRRFFREETWRIAGQASGDAIATVVRAASDDGLPLLLTLPKLRFNRAFVGRVRDRRMALKHRTRPLIWPVGPGSYFFSGQIDQQPGGGSVVAGRYKLRPTLAVMYYVYLTLGFGCLAVAVLAALGGTAAWAALGGISPVILLSGLKMLAVSTAFIALGWLHITLEKWLDGRNRSAVRALLERAVAAK